MCGPGRHYTDWEKRGGGNTERALKNSFGAISYFLEIAYVGEAYLIFEKISVLPKVYSTNRPNCLKTLKCFAKVTKVLCKALKCFDILCLSIVITYCYAKNCTKDDDLHPTSATPSVTVGPMLVPPSPLPWLPCCRHHCSRRHCRCHCHGCRRLRHHRFRCCCYRFLVDCCLPLHFLCFRHRCLPPSLLLLAADAIATVAAAANRCPLLLPPQPLPLFLPLFSLVMFKIFLRPSNILNIFVLVPCSFRHNHCLCFYRCPLLALFPLPSFSVFDNGLPPMRSYFLVMFKILQQILT